MALVLPAPHLEWLPSRPPQHLPAQRHRLVAAARGKCTRCTWAKWCCNASFQHGNHKDNHYCGAHHDRDFAWLGVIQIHGHTQFDEHQFRSTPILYQATCFRSKNNPNASDICDILLQRISVACNNYPGTQVPVVCKRMQAQNGPTNRVCSRNNHYSGALPVEGCMEDWLGHGGSSSRMFLVHETYLAELMILIQPLCIWKTTFQKYGYVNAPFFRGTYNQFYTKGVHQSNTYDCERNPSYWYFDTYSFILVILIHKSKKLSKNIELLHQIASNIVGKTS